MKRYFKNIKAALLLIVAAACTHQASAQLNPMGAMYFQNQYLGNPAFAGIAKGLDINMGYRKQWSNVPGSPTIQTVTADYALNQKSGAGINVYNDKAGLFKRTRSLVSYAYHLPLNSVDAYEKTAQTLSFGISLGFSTERLSNEDLNGDPNDPSVGNYNQRDTYLDGDFGVAYTGSGLTIQAALPNLKSVFKKDLTTGLADRATFFTAASYKISISEGATGVGLEPKVAYRGVKGFDNIIDAGANLSFSDNKISLFGMYHSSKSSTFGLGLNYQSIGFGGMYTTATSALSNYANGNFEVSVKLNLFNKK